MRMLDLEFDRMPNKMVTEKEARKHLAAGIPVVCRLTEREWYEIYSEEELERFNTLVKEGVYVSLKFYT